MKTTLAAVALLALAACSPAPTPTLTPSAPVTSAPSSSASAGPTACMSAGTTFCVTNPTVTQADIGSTICRSGWTATIRPPVSYTEPLKLADMKAEGLTGSPSNYEMDHRLPLELGGDPRDPHNLSPEAHPASYTKDHDENAYKAQVCDDALPLLAAQEQFIAKWLGSYPAYRTP